MAAGVISTCGIRICQQTMMFLSHHSFIVIAHAFDSCATGNVGSEQLSKRNSGNLGGEDQYRLSSAVAIVTICVLVCMSACS